MLTDITEPEKFYKYRSMQPGAASFVLKTITDNEVYFASPDSFNDIFDCKPVLTFACTDEQFIKYYIDLARKRGAYFSRERVLHDALQAIGDPDRDPRLPEVMVRMQRNLALSLKKAGVYCVSEINDDILMWSHYADHHRGICLEFDCGSNEMNAAQRVIYANERPTIDQFGETNSQEKMEKALLTKSSHWNYEREWRIIHQVRGVGPVKLDSHTLSGLIFGAAASAQVKEQIRASLAESGVSVPLYQARADDRKFKISVVRVD